MVRVPSAGGVVVGPQGKVLVVSQNGDSWSLPKGRIDSGEDARTAAEREIAEESGITKLTFVKELGSYQRHRIGKGGKGEDASELKTITFFLYQTDETQLNPLDPHNPEARWLAPEDVADLLTHPKDKAFYQSVLPQIQALLTN